MGDLRKQVTRVGNRSAALTAVTMGQLDKLDAALIARCHGLTFDEVACMIAVRLAREVRHG